MLIGHGACGTSVVISYDGVVDEMADFLNGYDVECTRALPSACCELMDPLSPHPIAVPPIQNSAGVSQLTSDLEIEGARERCRRCMSDTVHHVGGAGGGRSYMVWGRKGLRWFDPEMMMCVLRSINLRTRSSPLLESKLNHCRLVGHKTVVTC